MPRTGINGKTTQIGVAINPLENGMVLDAKMGLLKF